MTTTPTASIELHTRHRRADGSTTRRARTVNITVRPDPRVLVSVEEAAERLDIGRTMLYELIAAGEIGTVTVGRLRKVPVAEISEFVERRRARERQRKAG